MKGEKKKKEGSEGGREGKKGRKEERERQGRAGGGEKKREKKEKRTEQPFLNESLLSQLPIVCWLLSTWRYAFHFKTHLGLQIRKQLASSHLRRLSILCDNGGQVLK